MRSVVWILLLICMGCESSEAPPTVVVQDSAGVRIVENIRPLWEEGELWRVSQEPVLSLGSLDGDEAFAFHRITGVYLLGDNRIAVLDEGASQVRFFDLNGAPRSTFGGPGEGPGEFQALTLVGLSADSVWVFDGRQLRTTVFHPVSGGFRVARAAMDNAGLGPVGLLPGGSLLLTADLAFSSAIIDQLPAGLQRFGAAYIRVGPLGALEDTVFVSAGSERILRYGAETVEMLRPLLPRSVSHAIRNDEILQGSQDTYEIAVYSDDGTLRSLIRRSDIDLRLDEALFSAAMEERVTAAPEAARPGLRSLYQDQGKPQNRPAYSRFLVDSEGYLWVQDFSYTGEARSWAVFNLEGTWLGSVEFPDRFRPTQILEDRVFGIWRDDYEVEYARIYEMTRG